MGWKPIFKEEFSLHAGRTQRILRRSECSLKLSFVLQRSPNSVKLGVAGKLGYGLILRQATVSATRPLAALLTFLQTPLKDLMKV
jgi:hypothetical protein